MKTEEKRSFIDWMLDNEVMISLLVVLLGFLCGTILVLAVGKNPANMFSSIFDSMVGIPKRDGTWNFRYIGETLAYSMPYILCGLSMGLPCRVGLFNIGAEGQYIMGMTAAQSLALFISPFPGQWFFCLLVAFIAGALWGGIVGLLKAKYNVSEVVATIMLNYIALYASRLICFHQPGATTYNTDPLPATALLSKFLIKTSNLNIGIFFVLLSVLLYWFVVNKTKLGYSMRATGYNKNAAKCCGISTVRSIAASMALAGAFAGLAGAIVLQGGAFPKGRIITGMDNYGFMGIAVSLVGNNTAIGNLLAGLLFGVLKQSQSLMQSRNIPKEITFIIQGLIVVFISLRSGLELVKLYRNKKKLQKEVLHK
ncbi:MAG: ABC transporter permease [Spirochaetia bacterium]|jgi:simple sugar transport system permease protein|nr:ABC transporter permease [Spirochaetia bacterium]